MKNWRVAGINFDDMYMGDLLREVYQHPNAEIVGISDTSAERVQPALAAFNLGPDKGTITSYDYQQHMTMQTRPRPIATCIEVDVLKNGHRSAVEHVIDRIETGRSIDGPLDPLLSRIGQQIIDSAVLFAKEKRTVGLLP